MMHLYIEKPVDEDRRWSETIEVHGTEIKHLYKCQIMEYKNHGTQSSVSLTDLCPRSPKFQQFQTSAQKPLKPIFIWSLTGMPWGSDNFWFKHILFKLFNTYMDIYT